MGSTNGTDSSATELKILNDYLNTLSPENELRDHVRAFTKGTYNTYRAGEPESAVEQCLWDAWNAVVKAAQESKYDSMEQKRLVTFVHAVQQMPDLMRGDLNEATVWGAKVWQDMPVFGAAVREKYNFSPDQAGNDPDPAARWVNLNAFLARLTQLAHDKSLKAFDFSLYAIWSLRTALEGPEPSATPIAIDTAARAAAVWMVYAAPALWHHAQLEKMFDGKMAKPGEDWKEKEWRGFNLDRWELWQEQLGKDADRDLEGNGETKKLTSEAVETMEKVSKQ